MTGRDWVEIILGFVNLLFGLLFWFFKTERTRIVDDIKDTRMRCDKLEGEEKTITALLFTNYMTKTDHERWENQIMAAIRNLSEKLDRLIERRQ